MEGVYGGGVWRGCMEGVYGGGVWRRCVYGGGMEGMHIWGMDHLNRLVGCDATHLY
jgi:hypothetical protein